mgnify:CR=1 FL=1
MPRNTQYIVRFKLNCTIYHRQHHAFRRAARLTRGCSFLTRESFVNPRTNRASNSSTLSSKPTNDNTRPFSQSCDGHLEMFPSSSSDRKSCSLSSSRSPWLTEHETRHRKDCDDSGSNASNPHLNPEVRILACAPSNSAANIIAERLSARFSEDNVFRMHAYSRQNGDTTAEGGVRSDSMPQLSTLLK